MESNCMEPYGLGVSLGTLGAIPAAALDPNITTLAEIPQPPIMGNVDPSKIDEIRRTVYVGNLNSQGTLFDLRHSTARISVLHSSFPLTLCRYKRNHSGESNSMRFKINHSNNAIVKPPEMTPQAAAKELEEVMKRVREAQSFISAAIEPDWFPDPC
ncbi:splicing regulatory glutamine/lysine-rich protein 1-like protein [Turdus rufiventris]|nr:splicing regulatory glutamine/lysine-rich protein 1-like protein [Turdus rufiventris]